MICRSPRSNLWRRLAKIANTVRGLGVRPGHPAPQQILEPLENRLLLSATMVVYGAPNQSVVIPAGTHTYNMANSTDFGATGDSGDSVARTYAISNAGNTDLLINGSLVTIGGANAGDFSVSIEPGADVTAGTQTEFTIVFTPSAAGVRQATVTIASNDPNTPSYTFNIQGTGLDVTTTSDGLQYAVNTPGTGNTVVAGDNLIVNYTGYLTDGTVFDTSLSNTRTPFSVSSIGSASVITGWNEGLIGMQVGETRTLIIPAALGYGDAGQGSIPGGATLIFVVTLLSDNSQLQMRGGDGLAQQILDTQLETSTAAHTDFGNVAVTGGSAEWSFSMVDFGTQAITLVGTPWVTISGANASDFTIAGATSLTNNQIPAPGSAGYSMASFSILFNPSAVGLRTATVTIVTTDPTEGSFSFAIQGTGAPTALAGTEDTPLTITFASLYQALYGVAAPVGAPSFIIKSVDSGTLTKGGSAVTAGTTLISPGDSVVWTPAANANHTLGAFTVQPYSSGQATGAAIPVQVEVTPVEDAPTGSLSNIVMGSSTTAQSKQVNLASSFSDPDVTGTILCFNTSMGTFYVNLFSNVSSDVTNFLTYVTSGAYSDSVFHYSSPGSLLSGGEYSLIGATSSGPVQITESGTADVQTGYSNVAGTLSLDFSTSAYNANACEFSFNIGNNSAARDGNYTVIGEVMGSMSVLNAISALPLASNTTIPVDQGNWVVINSVTEVPPLTYTVSSSNTAVATVTLTGTNHDQLSLNMPARATGSTIITVTATDVTGRAVTKTFTLSIPVVTVTVSDAGGVYNGSSYPATATVAGGTGSPGPSLEGVSPTLAYYLGTRATGTSSSIAPTAAGTYTVVASYAGSTDYAAALSSPVTFTITKATATVAVADAGGSYSGSTFPATATVTGISGTPASSLEGISPTFTYYVGAHATGVGSSTAPSAAGTYTVVASFAASADYAAAQSTPLTFTIGKTVPTLAVTDASGPYSGSRFAAAATVTGLSGTPAASLEGISPTFTYYVGTGVNGTGSATAPTTGGTYTVVASFAGSADYAAAQSAPLTFEILQWLPIPDQVTSHDLGVSLNLVPLVSSNGNSLTFTATISSAQGEAQDLQSQLNLTAYASASNNARGWGEKYLSDAAGNWYYILPTGALYKWAGVSSATGNTFEAELDTGYYQNPLRLVYANWTGWSAAAEATAAAVQQSYSLAGYLPQDNNARGWGEKYLTDSSGNFYYLLANGALYQWNGVNTSTGNTLIETVDASFYQDPSRLVYAWAGASPTSATATATGGLLQVSPSQFQGRFPVKLVATDSSASAAQYIWVTMTNSGPALNLPDIPMVHGTTQQLTLGPATDADGDNVTYTVAVSSAQAEVQTIQLAASLPQYNNARGWGEKYLTDSSGNFYYILSTGALYKWAGVNTATGNTLVGEVDAGYYQNPLRLIYATWTGWDAASEAAASSLEQAQGLAAYLPQYNNARGWGEKYMTDAAGNFYYILSTGAVYKWNGINTATGNTLIGTVNTAFYQDPSRLVYAWAAAAPDPSVVSVAGTQMTVTPGSFVGRFPVYVTATDGIVTNKKFMWVTVTNAAPTITLTDIPMLDGDTPTLPLGPATDADGDPVTYTATLSSAQAQANALQQQLNLAAYLPQYNNARGWGEKYMTDAAGNFYYILPTGAVYAWAGSSSSTGNTLEGQLDTGYYQDPARLVYANFTGWSAANEATAYTLEQAQGLTTYLSQYNNARGWNEKYMTDAAGNFYYILPTGAVYKWNGINTSTGNTLIGTVDTAFYQDPSRLVHSWAVAAPGSSVIGAVSGTHVTVTPGSFVGRFLMYVTATDGIATTTKYIWVTAAPNTLAGLSSIGMTQTQPRTLTLGPATDGSGGAITYTVTTSSAQAQANSIQQQVNLTAYWAPYNNARGWSEKYLTDAAGNFYYILPTGAVYKWNGVSSATGNTLIATLDAGYYQDPRRLVYANFTGWSAANEAAASTLALAQGLTTYLSQYNNARGWGEKYLTDAAGNFYYILPTGAVYKWAGVSNPTGNTLVGTVDTTFYQDPSRLACSWAVAAADPSVVSVTGAQLTITPGAFLGQLLLCVTSTASTGNQYVWLTVS